MNSNMEAKIKKSEQLARIIGHPVHILMLENKAIAGAVSDARRDIEGGRNIKESVGSLSVIKPHIAKIGDNIYPLLDFKYKVTGPSEVLWSEDIAIRDTIGFIETRTEANGFLARIDEMLKKEKLSLFPMCAQLFSEEEWIGIYREFKHYRPCLIGEYPVWDEGEKHVQADTYDDAEVVLPTGKFTLRELQAVLAALPVELTFIDADNINSYFNEGDKLFNRPMMALERDVFSCHPPKSREVVRSILDDFRTGRQDSVEMWSEKSGVPILLRYIAVRDKLGKYLGMIECVQDMSVARDYFI
ncbi:MAG: PAS domain-containing protein [Saccharofermentans sp.]|jgi:DUF438 domain-containing protein|nr:PAS domain-containing protein [Mageeibacillus sp.]MCI1263789.1 PAS domain-containing protein [Saccharofermentans sp.]MCI1274744.1 PAS domain-containing protein [Saccharofermentans sp.]MCI2044714.1 PAS domain-containing protein [Mageeibacillus sp.]